jgi:sterol desaturase/sphingolipid hydroxylase (fatty acid hydroxylase superfamily)
VRPRLGGVPLLAITLYPFIHWVTYSFLTAPDTGYFFGFALVQAINLNVHVGLHILMTHVYTISSLSTSP